MSVIVKNINHVIHIKTDRSKISFPEADRDLISEALSFSSYVPVETSSDTKVRRGRPAKTRVVAAKAKPEAADTVTVEAASEKPKAKRGRKPKVAAAVAAVAPTNGQIKHELPDAPKLTISDVVNLALAEGCNNKGAIFDRIAKAGFGPGPTAIYWKNQLSKGNLILKDDVVSRPN